MPTRRWAAVASAALAALAAPAAGAQPLHRWFDAPRTFSVFEENDAFTDTDTKYTQGLRLTGEFSVWNPRWQTTYGIASLTRLVPRGWGLGVREPVRGQCLPRSARADQPCGAVSLGLGQTIYTPADLIASEVQPGDRPFAGWLFGSFGWSALYAPEARKAPEEPKGWVGSVQVTTDLIVGVTGPPSLARHTQSLAHWTWSTGSGQPQGWHNQLGTTVHVNLVNQYAVRPRRLERCLGDAGCTGTYAERRVFDLTPRAELALGSLMTRASTGAILRFGRRFPDAMGIQRIPITRGLPQPSAGARRGPSWWWMGFATADGRLVGHNALLSGSPLADGGEGEWRDVSRIRTRRWGGEGGGGLAWGYRRATLMGQLLWRAAEYAPGDDTHRFAVLTLSLHEGARD